MPKTPTAPVLSLPIPRELVRSALPSLPATLAAQGLPDPVIATITRTAMDVGKRAVRVYIVADWPDGTSAEIVSLQICDPPGVK